MIISSLDPKLRCVFRIFDAEETSLDADQNQLYGNHDLKLLIKRVNVVSGKQTLKVVNDYQRLKKRMILSEFEFFRDAGAVCNIIARDEIFRGIS